MDAEGYFPFYGWAKSVMEIFGFFHFLGLHALQVLSLARLRTFLKMSLEMFISFRLFLDGGSGILWISFKAKSLF